METVITAQLLARALRDGRLAVLVGSGTSAKSTDQSGREYHGLPLTREFVKYASKQHSYVSPEDAFTDACDAILMRERRAGLEELLLRCYRVPANFDPPPAHRILSWLPISLYITSNYDQLIERSLEREGRRPLALIDNEDLIRLKQSNTPVIKYHGCVSRPSTLVAATNDYENLERQRTLIKQLISVSLAGKILLVIGHGLNDWDLVKVLRDFLEDLGDYAPNVFIVREPGSAPRVAKFNYDHQVIPEDLTQFLNRLLYEYRQMQQVEGTPPFNEQWLSSAFFATLRQASVLPTETQVIDAFLHHLLEELSARGEVESVKLDAASAVSHALRERPNYVALTRIWRDVQQELVEHQDDLAAAERAVESWIRKRSSTDSLFRDVGFKWIQANERVLLYSQSKRVLQALQGVPQSRQRTCHLFVSECRPKSPNPYQDAAATCKELSETYFSLTVCPDVVAHHLLQNKQIDRVIMGTHALYVEDASRPTETAHSFVNTCGSAAIVMAASQYDIPVVVVAEQMKVEEVAAEEAEDHMHSHEENDLLQGVHGLMDLETRREHVQHLNIGYDRVPITGGVFIEIPDGMAH